MKLIFSAIKSSFEGHSWNPRGISPPNVRRPEQNPATNSTLPDAALETKWSAILTSFTYRIKYVNGHQDKRILHKAQYNRKECAICESGRTKTSFERMINQPGQGWIPVRSRG